MIPDYRIKTEAKGIALIEEYYYFNTGKQYSASDTGEPHCGIISNDGGIEERRGSSEIATMQQPQRILSIVLPKQRLTACIF